MRPGSKGTAPPGAAQLIGIGAACWLRPATPPGMRVRTGRFVSLRSGQVRHSQLIIVRNGKHRLNGIQPHVIMNPFEAGRCTAQGR